MLTAHTGNTCSEEGLSMPRCGQTLPHAEGPQGPGWQMRKQLWAEPGVGAAAVCTGWWSTRASREAAGQGYTDASCHSHSGIY